MLKIPHSIRQYYNDLYDKYEELEAIVCKILQDNVLNEKWLFLHRIKSKESFYFKLQTGRIDAAYEDFLACTIVVENLAQVLDAEKRLLTYFSLAYRRPEHKKITKKSPEEFVFDDLRLYLKLKRRDLTNKLQNVIFEFQIKTYLQHAWTIATHDLIYKPIGGSDWAMARVAYQIKAMLEHAEISIAQVKHIARAKSLQKVNEKIKLAKKVQTMILDRWPDGMGNHIERVAENIIRLLQIVGCNENELFNWIDSETAMGRGSRLTNFSPYEIALEAIVNHYNNAKIIFKKKTSKSTKKIVVPAEFMANHPDYDSIFYSINLK